MPDDFDKFLDDLEGKPTATKEAAAPALDEGDMAITSDDQIAFLRKNGLMPSDEDIATRQSQLKGSLPDIPSFPQTSIQRRQDAALRGLATERFAMMHPGTFTKRGLQAAQDAHDLALATAWVRDIQEQGDAVIDKFGQDNFRFGRIEELYRIAEGVNPTIETRDGPSGPERIRGGIESPERARKLLDDLKARDAKMIDNARGTLFAASAGGAFVSSATFGIMDPLEDLSPASQEMLVEYAETASFLETLGISASGLIPAVVHMNAVGAAYKAGMMRFGVSEGVAATLATPAAMGTFAAAQGEDVGEAVMFGFLAPAAAKAARGALGRIAAGSNRLSNSAWVARTQNSIAEAIGFAGAGSAVHGFNIDQAGIDMIVGAAMGAMGGTKAQRKQNVLGRLERLQAKYEKASAAKKPEISKEIRDFWEKAQKGHADLQKPAEAEVKPLETKKVEAQEVVESGKIEPKPKETADAVQEAQAAPAEVRPEVKAEAPKEPVQEAVGDGFVTSIKNRVVNRERAERGLEEMAQPLRKKWGETVDEALRLRESNPKRPEEVAQALAEGKKTGLDKDVEGALLDIHRVELLKAKKAADIDGVAAAKKGDADAVADARKRAQANSDALVEAEIASQRSGTEAGRGLAFRKAMMRDNFSLEKMTADRMRENNYEPLNPKQKAEVAALHGKLAKALKERDAHADRVAELEASKGVQAVVKAGRSRTPPPSSPKFGATNKFVTREAFESLKAELVSGTQATTGIDLAKWGKVAAFYVEGGIRSAGQFTKALVAEFGEGIRPHAAALWNEGRKQMRGVLQAEAVGKIKSRVEKGEPLPDRLVGQLAESFVRSGVNKRGELVDSVHEVLRDIDPNITRRETMDAISGYGKLRTLDKDPVKAELRELKGQMQKVAQLEDMAGGKAPLKTGFEQQLPGPLQRELRREVNKAKRESGFDSGGSRRHLKSALESLKARLETRIADVEGRLASGDFAPREKPVPIPRDSKAIRLEARLEELKKQWAESLIRDRLKNRPLHKKILAAAFVEAPNAARSIMASMDLSAVLRQGAFIGFGHPVRAARAMPTMFRALRSKDGQAKAEAEIRADPQYKEARDAGLFLSEHGATSLSRMEEVYMSRWAEKIPLVAASQRAYSTYLNKIRMDSYRAMTKSLSATGKPTPKEAKAIANYVNVATGRGGPGGHSNAMAGLNTMFFAPRLVASRFQLLAGEPMARGSARTRKLVAQEYARFLLGMGVTYALAEAAGAEVEWDSRSSDFGKVRFGNSRLDPMGGLSQVSVFSSRLATGETKRIRTGEVVPIRGEGVPFGGGASNVIWNFVRSKSAPVIGGAINVAAGKNVVGEERDVGSQLLELGTPMVFNDILDAMKEQGVPEGTALGLMAMFGMSLQTFDPNESKKRGGGRRRSRGGRSGSRSGGR